MRRSLVVLLYLSIVGSLPVRAQILNGDGVSPWSSANSDGFDRPIPKRAAIKNKPNVPLTEPGSNIDVTRDAVWDQMEPSIAIDPTDPQNVVIGLMNDENWGVLWYAPSHDAGQTWRDSVLPKQTLMDVATDPSVAFDRSGVEYFVNGRYESTGGVPYPRNDVACFRSTDRGESWSLTASVFSDSLFANAADTLSDKYYLGIDNSNLSPYRGRLYVTWVEEEGEDTLTRIVVASSSDSGYHWTKRVFVTPDESFYHSPVPTVGRDGELYISYIDILHKHIDVAVSEDGGQTFQNAVVSDYRDLGPIEPNNDRRGYPVIKGKLGVNSFPATAADARTNSSGRVYLVWAAKGSDDRAHVFLSIGTNRGNSWTTATPVERDSSVVATDKFFPWVAVDQVTGHVGIDFYDSRLDPTNKLCDLFLAISNDSGLTFSDQRVSTASMDPTVGRDSRQVGVFEFKFFGDYIGLDGRNGVWHPVWCDSRTGKDLEVYTATVTESTNAVRAPVTSTLKITTYGAGPTLRVRVDGADPGWLHLEVVDILGRIVKRQTAETLGSTVFEMPNQGENSLFYRLYLEGEGGTQEIRTGRLR